ncbi:MAG: tellurite resistance TerB family protein [Gammaproteobacteria bacterium]|nr:tellurite resistance TerB family protein [Gammaproteobacteria bacterium]
MEARKFLDDLLGAAKDLATRGKGVAEERMGLPDAGPEREAMLTGLGKGALAAGALAVLLGTGIGRRLTGTALKLGGLAAVGGVAYQAYRQWQQQNDDTVDTPVDKLNTASAEQRSRLLLRAMIAAAKADGHIDVNERAAIDAEIERLGLDIDTSEFLIGELSRPLDVDALAAEVDSTTVAAEVYLASRLVIDLDNEQERDYLNRLAVALKLAPELIAQLENDISGTST